MANFLRLKGLATLVTGGASGLGRATCTRFVKEGARVILCDLPESEGENVAGELGKECIFIPTNVTSESEVKTAVDRAVEEFGRLDVAVSCAGIATAITIYNANKDFPHNLEYYDRMMKVNVVGTFNVIRTAAAAMAKNTPSTEGGQRGVLVTAASVAAYDGQRGQGAYSATQGALVAMTLPIARDLSSIGVRLVCIAPGIIQTPLVGTLPDKIVQYLSSTVTFPKRLGNPDEFAQAVEAVIENPYINGEVIRLDGGLRTIG